MRKTLLIFLILAGCMSAVHAQTTINVFDTVLYYDGYATTVTTPAPPAGIIRHRNDLYARKLTAAELSLIGSSLQMKVTIKAACDNYDRIGSVNMALVPKGATTYKTDSVQHIEMARYITPFMNKNVSPTQVPYSFDISNLAAIFKETSIAINYDFWIELEVFGVPYAANTQVAGCSGRNDVFYGSLEFTTNSPAATQSDNVLMPLYYKANLNNYQASGTDTMGKTVKTISFNVPNNLSDASLYLITSNHGANSGGEEYNRRNHIVYVDNVQKLTYKPGRLSCEPFRQYNTQSNGIYGSTAKSDAQWQSFSNWCPGDVIDIRKIDLGAVAAGNHSFRIEVPTAVFAAGQGNIPLSLYLQGKKGGANSIAPIATEDGLKIYPNPASGMITVNANQPVEHVMMTNVIGAIVFNSGAINSSVVSVDTKQLPAGIYSLQVKSGTKVSVHKIQVVH